MSIRIYSEMCNGCGACYDICENNGINILYDEDKQKRIAQTNKLCVGCCKCLTVCKEGAIGEDVSGKRDPKRIKGMASSILDNEKAKTIINDGKAVAKASAESVKTKKEKINEEREKAKREDENRELEDEITWVSENVAVYSLLDAIITYVVLNGEFEDCLNLISEGGKEGEEAESKILCLLHDLICVTPDDLENIPNRLVSITSVDDDDLEIMRNECPEVSNIVGIIGKYSYGNKQFERVRRDLSRFKFEMENKCRVLKTDINVIEKYIKETSGIKGFLKGAGKGFLAARVLDCIIPGSGFMAELVGYGAIGALSVYEGYGIDKQDSNNRYKYVCDFANALDFINENAGVLADLSENIEKLEKDRLMHIYKEAEKQFGEDGRLAFRAYIEYLISVFNYFFESDEEAFFDMPYRQGCDLYEEWMEMNVE